MPMTPFTCEGCRANIDIPMENTDYVACKHCGRTYRLSRENNDAGRPGRPTTVQAITHVHVHQPPQPVDTSPRVTHVHNAYYQSGNPPQPPLAGAQPSHPQARIRSCPYCRESILYTATVCRHCRKTSMPRAFTITVSVILIILFVLFVVLLETKSLPWQK
jgi:uncharacterized Zn-finger protein